eukprot:1157388-Pelagomonas_calceolata.AAC.7
MAQDGSVWATCMFNPLACMLLGILDVAPVPCCSTQIKPVGIGSGKKALMRAPAQTMSNPRQPLLL